MTDNPYGSQPAINKVGPLKSIVAVDISSTDDTLASQSRAIYVGTSGDIKLETSMGSTVTLPSLAAGIWHAVECVKVFKTGTTASGIFYGF